MFGIRELRRRLKQGDAKETEAQPQSPIANAGNPPELSASDSMEAVRSEKIFHAKLLTLFDLFYG